MVLCQIRLHFCLSLINNIAKKTISMFSPNIRLKTLYIYFDLKKPDPNKKKYPRVSFYYQKVKWFLITGCFNDRKKGFHFSLFQFDTLHKLCDVPHHSFNNKKYLTILNHFFYTVSAPPQLFQSEPTAKRHCSTARYQGPQVVGWFTKRSQHIGLTAGTSHLKNRMAINRWF